MPRALPHACALLFLAACLSLPCAAQESAGRSAEPGEPERLHAQVVELYGKGKFDEALPLAERVVALREQALGPDDVLVGDALGNVADVLYMKRKYKEAEAALRRQLAIYEKAPGDRGQRMAGALDRFVCLLDSRERWDELMEVQLRLFKLENGFDYDPSMSVRPQADQKRAGLLIGRMKSSPPPRYPPAAKQANMRGAVVMKVTVDEAGGVASARALCGPPLLTRSALEAVSQNRYEPLSVGGRPVKYTGVAIYRFVFQSF